MLYLLLNYLIYCVYKVLGVSNKEQCREYMGTVAYRMAKAGELKVITVAYRARKDRRSRKSADNYFNVSFLYLKIAQTVQRSTTK